MNKIVVLFVVIVVLVVVVINCVESKFEYVFDSEFGGWHLISKAFPSVTRTALSALERRFYGYFIGKSITLNSQIDQTDPYEEEDEGGGSGNGGGSENTNLIDTL